MENIAIEIHKELASALENEMLPNLSTKKVEKKFTDKQEVYADFLNSVGFNGIPLVKKIREESGITESIDSHNRDLEMTREMIQKIQAAFPTNRIISYTALNRVMEKYGLYIGAADRFIQNIPIKNLEQLSNFTKNYNSKRILNNFSWSLNNKMYDLEFADRDYNSPSFAVAATIDCFEETENRTIIGRELNYISFTKPKFEKGDLFTLPDFKDPIILAPFSLRTPIGKLAMFVIVTAWGKEASDPEIMHALNN